VSKLLHVVDDLSEVLVAQAFRELRRLVSQAFDVGRNPSLILVPQLLPGLANSISQRGEAMDRPILSPAEPIGCLLPKLIGE
jgi:hypothetical protein